MTVRILHVVGGMNPGGVETWLMNLLRHIDRNRFQMDFLVHTTERRAYDSEIRTLDSRVIPCLHPRRPLIYARNFHRILKRYGPYDLVHSHVYLYSGYVVQLAHAAGVPTRISHGHTDVGKPVRSPLDRLYSAVMRRWIKLHATNGLACSRQAAEALYGTGWEEEKRWRVVSYSQDFSSFRNPPARKLVRKDLGIPADAFVIGHVGRFTEPKNHTFLVAIAREVATREPRARFLLIGDGKLRPGIEEQVARLGLTDRFIFAGTRSDVPRLLLGAMDLFLFPSLWEGLGLAVVEAQAAGLPCVLAESVPPEADAVSSLLRRLPLSAPPSEWADAIQKAVATQPSIDRREALAMVEKSPFNILTGAKAMETIYGG